MNKRHSPHIYKIPVARMISSFQEAVEHFRITMGAKVLEILHGPTAIMRSRGKMYMVQFKRDYYKSFSRHFPEIEEKWGYGQVMNLGLLKRAVDKNMDQIVFITPDRKMYSCYPKLFMRFYENNRTDVPYLDGEIAMPLKFFKRIGK